MEGADEGAPTGCLVPKLKGRTLRGAKRRLGDASCKLGHVKTLRGVSAKTGRVVKQNPKPGVVLAPGKTVQVKLGG